jgi:DNA-binding NarL/FixJ family response regulator
MTTMLQREVLVLSDDGEIRDEVGAAVARRPGAHAVYGGQGVADGWAAVNGSDVVVIDDEGRSDAVDLVRRLLARRETSVVYLATHHSATLEAEVRRAGVSFYAVKAARDGDLTRVIESLLARSRA